jgi:ABC-type nitrate/sulfonate/bicarbonate transport system permease component
MRSVDFPSPYTTFRSLFKSLQGMDIYDYSIYHHTITSLLRWAFAYVIAILISILVGFFLGLYPMANKLFMPLVHVLQLIAGLAWIPIAMLIFRLGNVSTVFMVFMLAVTPIIITTATGIRETPPNLINAAIIMGANKRMLFIHVLLPSVLFHIIDGMRIGFANSWRILLPK